MWNETPDTGPVRTGCLDSARRRRWLAPRLAVVRCGLILLAALAAACDGGGTEEDTENSQAIVALGQAVFFDPALSADGGVACASCHRPELAYSDGRSLATGVSGRRGTRNAPSLLDVGRQRSLFWDGRRTRLEDQAIDPLLSEVEHGLPGEAALLRIIRAQPRYVDAFQSAYGISADQITVRHVAGALAAFERTLVTTPSPFDRFLGGQRDAMSAAARRGWELFDQRVQCTRCHVVAGEDGRPPLLTDHQFHSLRIGFHKVERKLPRLTQRLLASQRTDRAEGAGSVRNPAHDVPADADLAELGRFLVTLDPRDVAAFKTPGLRNVAITGPYMHDGSVVTLTEAIDLEVYYRGSHDARPLLLTAADRNDLIAFLHALTSDDLVSRTP
jgi:cytochrome c peroxidase